MNRIFMLAAAALLVGAVPAVAQINVPRPITTPEAQRQAAKHPSVEPAPAGVPGARAEPDSVTPADRVAADMPPNEALFDAINRGDLAAAKDAIGRGADIHAQNVLGLTPVELSVDLGRSDISFLLLSLRGAAGYGAGGPPRQAAADHATPAQSQAERQAARVAEQQQAAASKAALRRSGSLGAAPARNAQLFAGDGGEPVPQAGFLGFGAAK